MNFRNCVTVNQLHTAVREERMKKKLGKRNCVRELGVNL